MKYRSVYLCAMKPSTMQVLLTKSKFWLPNYQHWAPTNLDIDLSTNFLRHRTRTVIINAAGGGGNGFLWYGPQRIY